MNPNAGWIRRLLYWMKPHKRDAIAAFSVAIVGTAIAAFAPLIEKIVIDDVVSDPKQAVWPWLLLLVFFGIARFGLAYVRRFRGGRIALAVQHDLRTAIFRQLQRLDFASHDQMQTGQLVSRAGSDIMLIQALLQFLPIAMGNLLLFLISLGIMLTLSPLLTLVMLLVTPDMLYTGMEALLGFALGSIAGFLLAALFVHVKPAERGLMPYVIASQTIPIIAIAPMIVVGVGRLGAPPWLSKSIIAAYLTFFPVTINALRGLTSVHRDQLALMQSYAASQAQLFFKLRLPASTPYLFTALKIASTASVVGAIIGELPVGSTHGLGVQLVIGSQYNTFNPGFLWATILMAAILGLIFYGLVALAERLIVRWRPPNQIIY